MTKPNAELLEQVMQYIEDHPEQWDQSDWVCETAGCFAGNALLLSGFERVYGDYYGRYTKRGERPDREAVLMRDRLFSPAGETRYVEQTAACALGLQGSQKRLFTGNNCIHTLRKLVERLKADPEVVFTESDTGRCPDCTY
jgi:hypothetical protein